MSKINNLSLLKEGDLVFISFRSSLHYRKSEICLVVSKEDYHNSSDEKVSNLVLFSENCKKMWFQSGDESLRIAETFLISSLGDKKDVQ